MFELENVGYILVRLQDRAGLWTERVVDLYLFVGKLWDAYPVRGDAYDNAAAAEARAAFLKADGWGDVSPTQAHILTERLFAEWSALEKKTHLPEPARTPGTTDSPCGSTAPADPRPGSSNGHCGKAPGGEELATPYLG